MQRKHEILAKLEQIQEQAQLTLDELPLRLAKDRLRLIIGLARYLSTSIDLKWEERLNGREERLNGREEGLNGSEGELSAAAVEDAAKRPPAAPRA